MYVLGDWQNFSDKFYLDARGSEMTFKGKVVANALLIGRTLDVNITIVCDEGTHVPEDDATWVIKFVPQVCHVVEAHRAGIRPVFVGVLNDLPIYGILQHDEIVLYHDGQKVTAKYPIPEGEERTFYLTGRWEI